MLEKNDSFKQRRISDMFAACEKPVPSTSSASHEPPDIEDCGGKKKSPKALLPVVTVSKRKRKPENEFQDMDLTKSWREVFGNPPPFGTTKEERLDWIRFLKKKWNYQLYQRNNGLQNVKKARGNSNFIRSAPKNTLGGFLLNAQRALITTPWQVIQIASTSTPGEFRLWALVQSEMHMIKLTVARVFYANLKTPKCADEGALFKKCNRTLPRSRPVYNLYMYSVPEAVFQEHGK